jgi:hypothetical protein
MYTKYGSPFSPELDVDLQCEYSRFLLYEDIAIEDEHRELMRFLYKDLPKYIKSLFNAHAVSLLRAHGFDVDSIFEEGEEGRDQEKREVKTIAFGDVVVHVMA